MIKLRSLLACLSFALCITVTNPKYLSADVDLDLDDLALFDDIFDDIDQSLLRAGPSIPDFGNKFLPWQNTAPARSRTALFDIPNKTMMLDRAGLDFHLVFQRQSRMAFPFHNRVNFDFLDPFLPAIPPDLRPLVQGALNIFEQFSVQERRGIFSTIWTVPFAKYFSFRMEVPIVGIQRNYWLHPLLQEDIRALFSSLPQEEGFLPISVEEIRASLGAIPKKIGFGDARLQLGIIPFTSKSLQFMIGAEVIPPLSSLTESGQKYVAPKPLEPGDFPVDLMEQIETLNRVSRRPVLGFDGHWGLGAFFEAKMPLFEGKIDIFTKMSFDSILPKMVWRDIPRKDNPFPAMFRVESSPGFITNALFGMNAYYRNLSFMLGYDFYMQSAERLSDGTSPDADSEQADYARAAQLRCFQHSIFSSLNYTWKKIDKPSVSLGLEGSLGLAREGIGRHWTLGLRSSVMF